MRIKWPCHVDNLLHCNKVLSKQVGVGEIQRNQRWSRRGTETSHQHINLQFVLQIYIYRRTAMLSNNCPPPLVITVRVCQVGPDPSSLHTSVCVTALTTVTSSYLIFRLPYSIAFDCSIRPFLQLSHSLK